MLWFVAERTEGRALLRKWMRAEKTRSQGFLAKVLDVTQPAVAAWVRGESRPAPQYRDAIFELTGISPEAWETKTEREKRDRALAGVRGVLAAPTDSERAPDSPPGGPVT
jgi:transcriptional regulator with XRE-family HTH domain